MKVLVIGGGIIGSSVAWRLAREQAEVTIVERGVLGQEASWAAAGMIAPQAEAQGPGPFFDLCLVARDAFAAIAPVLRDESGIDPEYDDQGILYVAFDAVETAELRERVRWQKDAGGIAIELSATEVRALEPALTDEVVYGVHLPADRRTENRKLTSAFAAAAVARGTKILTGAPVEGVIVHGSRATGVRLRDGSELTADVIVNAAGAWAGEIRGLEADGVATYPVRGQMLCFTGGGSLAGPSIFSVHGYLVPRRDGRLIAGSTMEAAGYEKQVTLEGIEKIARGARKMMPSLGQLPFREAWAGLRPATEDFLPILGASRVAGNVFYATGHFRSGILLAALTGEIIADLVFGRVPAIDLAPFAPGRLAKAVKVTALGLVRDILFRSRIDAAAQVLGVNVAYVSTLEQGLARCAELKPAIVFADLSDANFPAAATAAGVKRAGARLIGFASHVDMKTLKAARAAGFDQALSRSEFTARVAEFLR
jgi:glycine oxidase